jgi:hypothetical protein
MAAAAAEEEEERWKFAGRVNRLSSERRALHVRREGGEGGETEKRRRGKKLSGRKRCFPTTFLGGGGGDAHFFATFPPPPPEGIIRCLLSARLKDLIDFHDRIGSDCRNLPDNFLLIRLMITFCYIDHHEASNSWKTNIYKLARRATFVLSLIAATFFVTS